MNSDSPHYHSPVFHGDKAGRTIGFPTLNLDVAVIPQATQQGVWVSQVEVRGKPYAGAAYFGPRTIQNEVTNVLEIFLLDFDQEVYGEVVTFTLLHFVRPVIHFKSFAELKEQLHQDVVATKEYCAEHPLQ